MALVFLPIKPDGKDPAVRGWASESYAGVDPGEFGGHVGVRTDDLVVVDCDTAEAVDQWRRLAPATPLEVKTSRGVHFYYRRGVDTDLRPGSFADGIDIKTGPGAYVLAPGARHPSGAVYEGPELTVELIANLPDPPAFLTIGRRAPGPVEGGWEQIPEGQRNVTLTGVAGVLRRQGAAPLGIAKALAAINRVALEEPLDKDEIVAIAKSAGDWQPEPDVDNIEVDETSLPRRYAKDLTVKPHPGWLWRPYVPKSRLMLLDGAEGIGKTMLLCRIAVAVTTGQWIDNEADAGQVIWLGTEDDPEEDILPRLLALGYDPKGHHQVAFVEPVDFTAGVPEQLTALELAVVEDDVKLVLFDPIRSFLFAPGDRDASFNNEVKVRRPMEAMAQLARRTGATVLGSHHWRKSVEDGVKMAASGSAAFSQVVRHRVSMAWVGDTEEGEGALSVTKTNMRQTGGVLGYSLRAITEDLAVWEPGAPQAERDLDSWIDHARERWRERNALEYSIDPGDVMDALLAEPGLQVTRELLRYRGLSDLDAKAAMKELWEDPRFARVGRSLFVRGPISELPKQT